MKAIAIGAAIVALVLLYAIVRAVDEAEEAHWRAAAMQRAPRGMP